MRKSVSKVASMVVFLVICSVTMGLAQVDTATIVGTVREASGAVIPGASITATEVNTGIKTEVKSGADGNYVITPLKIGAYSLTVDAQGFQKVVRQNIVPNVQSGVCVDFGLRVGSVTQTVEVSGAPPLVHTTDASLGSVVGSQQVEQLPLNGRRYTDLAALTSGVITDTVIP